MRPSDPITKQAAWYSPFIAGLCLTWVVWGRSCEQGILPLKSGDGYEQYLQCCTTSHSSVWLPVYCRLCGLWSLPRAEAHLNSSPWALLSRDETKAGVWAGKVLLEKVFGGNFDLQNNLWQVPAVREKAADSKGKGRFYLPLRRNSIIIIYSHFQAIQKDKKKWVASVLFHRVLVHPFCKLFLFW